METTAAARPKTPMSAWWMVIVLTTLNIFSYIDRYVMTMLVIPIQKDTGLSDFQMSLVLGPAFAVFYTLFGLPLGWASDRYPRRWVVYFGASLWSIAAAGSGLMHSFLGLFTMRACVGIGETSLTPAVYSLVADAFPRHRMTIALSIYQTGVKLGQSAAFIAAAVAIPFAATMTGVDWPVVGRLHAWQMVLIMTGAPGLFLALLVFTFSEPPRTLKAANAPDRERLLVFLRRRAKLLGLMVLGFTMVTVAGYSLSTWTPTYLERTFGLGPVQFGPVLALISAIAAASMVLKGAIVDWLYARGVPDAHLRFYSWLLAASMPIAFVLMFLPNPWLFLVGYGLMQLITIQFTVYMGATLQLVAPPEIRAQLTGLFLSIFNLIGLGVGPMAIGALTDYVFGDPAMIGYSMAVVLIIAVPISFIAIRAALPQLNKALAENAGAPASA